MCDALHLVKATDQRVYLPLNGLFVEICCVFIKRAFLFIGAFIFTMVTVFPDRARATALSADRIYAQLATACCRVPPVAVA